MEYQERWEVKVVTVQPGVKADKPKLAEELSDGWEPFAVTWDGASWDYHLRKFRFEGDTWT